MIMKYLLPLLIALPCHARQIKIAVIDSGINIDSKSEIKLCPSGHLDFTGTGMRDTLGHGTNIAYTIANQLKNADYCIVLIKVFDVKHTAFTFDEIGFLYVFRLNNVDIVNYSAGGKGSKIGEKVLIQGLIATGIKVVAAAGNNDESMDRSCNYFPGCYDGVISVGNMMSGLKRQPSSNYGMRVKAWEIGTDICSGGVCMTGTSQAAAVHTGKLARKMWEESKK